VKRRWRHGLTLAAPMLLAACATTPNAVRAPVIHPPRPAAVPLPQPDVSAVVPARDDIWTRLRQSFAMSDCDADPHILSWAERYTRDPQRFEDHLREAMPRLVYVQQVAAQHDVAGEFVLLPWVESHFQPVSSHRHQRAAGMWQIVPSTARSMGLHVGRDYDGRYDISAATEGVMKLLGRYHADLRDWRLVDYAYNAGEFAVRRLVRQHGAPAAEPVIPSLPVSRITREHLTKLLAVACVVREPARFHVNLPLLPADQRLEAVAVRQPMKLPEAAQRAGMPLAQFKHLNAAFLDGHIAADRHPSQLMLPQRNAVQWRDAQRQAADAGLTASVTPSPSPLPALPVDNSGTPPPGAAENAPPLAVAAPPPSIAPSATGRTHTVRAGESLWSIAHRYAVSVRDLEHWNHLRGEAIRPGQVLRVGAG
jgi:membrane-bound lytic murein transglycosylase D